MTFAAAGFALPLHLVNHRLKAEAAVFCRRGAQRVITIQYPPVQISDLQNVLPTLFVIALFVAAAWGGSFARNFVATLLP
jgi:hypothetical protein